MDEGEEYKCDDEIDLSPSESSDDESSGASRPEMARDRDTLFQNRHPHMHLKIMPLRNILSYTIAIHQGRATPRHFALVRNYEEVFGVSRQYHIQQLIKANWNVDLAVDIIMQDNTKPPHFPFLRKNKESAKRRKDDLEKWTFMFHLLGGVASRIAGFDSSYTDND